MAIEELMAFGQLETYNKLKPAITQDTVRVNKKNVAQYDMENTANFLCTSNHDNPIKLDADDRRFFVYKSPATARDRQYDDHLFAWTDENLGVIANYLNTVDITGFSPDAPPPMTPAKAALIDASREALERILLEMIDLKEAPFGDRDLVLVRDVTRAVQGKGYGNFNKLNVSWVLPSVGFTKLTREKKVTRSGSRESLRLWCRANHEKWEAANGQPLAGSALWREQT